MKTLKGKYIGAGLHPGTLAPAWNMGNHASYLFFAPFENFGLSIVPSIRKGNDSLPSFKVAPSNRANVLVRKPCLVVIAATP